MHLHEVWQAGLRHRLWICSFHCFCCPAEPRRGLVFCGSGRLQCPDLGLQVLRSRAWGLFPAGANHSQLHSSRSSSDSRILAVAVSEPSGFLMIELEPVVCWSEKRLQFPWWLRCAVRCSAWTESCSQFSVCVIPLKIQVAFVGPWASPLLVEHGWTALPQVAGMAGWIPVWSACVHSRA